MSKTLTSKQYISQLNIIYFAQAGVMLIFAAIVFGINYVAGIGGGNNGNTSVFTYGLLATVIVGFSASHFLYGFMLSKIDKELPLQKKLPRYTGAIIVRAACLELPGMFAAVVFFLTSNIFVLLIPVFTAIVFVLLRPTAATIAEDLNLSSDERALINTPDAVVADLSHLKK